MKIYGLRHKNWIEGPVVKCIDYVSFATRLEYARHEHDGTVAGLNFQMGCGPARRIILGCTKWRTHRMTVAGRAACRTTCWWASPCGQKRRPNCGSPTNDPDTSRCVWPPNWSRLWWPSLAPWSSHPSGPSSSISRWSPSASLIRYGAMPLFLFFSDCNTSTLSCQRQTDQ